MGHSRNPVAARCVDVVILVERGPEAGPWRRGQEGRGAGGLRGRALGRLACQVNGSRGGGRRERDRERERERERESELDS